MGMPRRSGWLVLLVLALLALVAPSAAIAASPSRDATASRLATGLEGGSGSTVGPDVGGSDVVGIYRVDGPDSVTVVADIGAFSIANPPATDFFVPSGVQYALQAYRGRLLVTDGHHNRVLRVTRDGQITELRAFGNIVPTGLEVRGRTIWKIKGVSH
jgi:hypothetical protein